MRGKTQEGNGIPCAVAPLENARQCMFLIEGKGLKYLRGRRSKREYVCFLHALAGIGRKTKTSGASCASIWGGFMKTITVTTKQVAFILVLNATTNVISE